MIRLEINEHIDATTYFKEMISATIDTQSYSIQFKPIFQQELM